MGTRNHTAAAILEAGKQEFLSYGYEKASMRRIAQRAGVTTGAIYGYFPGKEALFEALTGETAQRLVDMYQKVHREFAAMPPERQAEELMNVTEEQVPWLINYVYDHFDTFKLLLCCGAPGAGNFFFDQMAQVEEQSCWDFADAMRKLGHTVAEFDDMLLHIVCRSFFQQIEEFVSHDVPREKAVYCARILGQFQHAGWARIMGL